MSAPQDPFNFSGMAATLAPAGNSGNPPPPYQQQQPPQHQYAQPPQPQQEQQLVVASQPNNPYVGIVPPQPLQQLPQQQHPTPWGAPPAPHSNFVTPPPQMPSTATAASFDPFAAPVAPAPAPVVAPPPAQQQQQHQQQQYPPPPTQDPWAAPAPAQQQQYQAPPMNPNETQIVPAQPNPHQQQEYKNRGHPSSYPNDNYGSNNQSYGNNDDDHNRQIVPANDNFQNRDPRKPYSSVLSQQISGGKGSALPKANLVGKKGFVLSRISFRTIVMKKWKQSFWIQYGGHTMLWFRSQSDFDDWLNNPYHTQMQRNFLIKLAINFVHDLYKPNVRGYQVTQCRTKPYGKEKVIRQFKLERWMDYGPTIAAAFGSYDPKEVDACREAIVGCMKNTPLDNGIRATGAVKEHHDRQQQDEWRREQGKREMEQHQNAAPQQNGLGGGYSNYSIDPNLANGRSQSMKAPRAMSMASVDLLGDNFGTDIDESASVPPGTYAPAPANDPFGGSGALVPAANPNAPYPGAPPAPPAHGAPGQQPAFYPSSAPSPQQQYQPQPQVADPYSYGAPAEAPGSQGYPQQHQQQQPPPPQYPVQAPAPSYGQPPPPPQPQVDYGGYPQQNQPQVHQQGGGAYPAASYPVPTQQF
eukprot:CAMPEP_0197173654 /NCGR_PEP_ID=MMETSP1423-20130617/497_1 /TAXON_ID=476441 /ORGANISM="Pseudo-nitzschia heimii, Strain UNC1101" /LENGTH=637 /DNA_ID=CAMNT_0042622491 /DNA_START=158 /DNA_END=2071 /DNA_ORIENTATION=+